ncbi:MAG: DUF952 domain-containing protein [Sphingomonas sp.]
MSSRPTTAYKVLTAEEMRALEADEFRGAQVDVADGFVHLSTLDQLTETVDKHFAGQSDLWIAAVDLTAFGDSLKWEESRGGALFPHIYGAMPLETVIAYGPLKRGDDGAVKLPVAG